MLSLLISIIGIIVTILLIIGIHELGHFLAARWLGVKVLRFSIGFGKTLLRKTDKTGTEYVFAAIPLGGYVKMLDENEETVATDQRHLAFNTQPFYKKFIIVAAGPFANFVLAIFLYWLIFVIGFTSVIPVIGKVLPDSIASRAGLKSQQAIVSIDNTRVNTWMGVAMRLMAHSGDQEQLPIETKPLGKTLTEKYLLDLTDWHMNDLKPDPLESLGIEPYEPDVPAVIGKIMPDTPAAKAQLKVHDKIIALNNIPIKNWIDLVTLIEKKPSEKLTLTIKRNGKKQIITLTTDYQRDMLFKKHGFIGISPDFEWPADMVQQIKYGPLSAISHAWQSMYDLIYLNLIVVGKLLVGKASLRSLGGPISIFQSAGLAVNQGLIPFMSFLAFLSISIGIINVFPIPGLDGGHLLFQSIEAIMRRPIPQRILVLSYRLGIIFLLIIIFQAIANDVLRLQ